jgi:hypothetical protein
MSHYRVVFVLCRKDQENPNYIIADAMNITRPILGTPPGREPALPEGS